MDVKEAMEVGKWRPKALRGKEKGCYAEGSCEFPDFPVSGDFNYALGIFFEVFMVTARRWGIFAVLRLEIATPNLSRTNGFRSPAAIVSTDGGFYCEHCNGKLGERPLKHSFRDQGREY